MPPSAITNPVSIVGTRARYTIARGEPVPLPRAHAHNDYADRKKNRQPVEYFHPDAEEVLGDTASIVRNGRPPHQGMVAWTWAQQPVAPSRSKAQPPRAALISAGS